MRKHIERRRLLPLAIICGNFFCSFLLSFCLPLSGIGWLLNRSDQSRRKEGVIKPSPADNAWPVTRCVTLVVCLKDFCLFFLSPLFLIPYFSPRKDRVNNHLLAASKRTEKERRNKTRTLGASFPSLTRLTWTSQRETPSVCVWVFVYLSTAFISRNWCDPPVRPCTDPPLPVLPPHRLFHFMLNIQINDIRFARPFVGDIFIRPSASLSSPLLPVSPGSPFTAAYIAYCFMVFRMVCKEFPFGI